MPKTLILIPTEMESRHLKPQLAKFIASGNPVELCGFGPIAAAASASHYLAEHGPDRACLVGIAGAYRQDLQLGEALSFSSVSAYGIGVGSGADHQSAHQLGWPQWSDSSGESIVNDHIEIDSTLPEANQLLTSCAASSCMEDVRLRLDNHPHAVAEDMEGFGVALACRLERIPCAIIRGVSNYAGQRDKADWKIESALDSAGQLVLQQMADSDRAGVEE